MARIDADTHQAPYFTLTFNGTDAQSDLVLDILDRAGQEMREALNQGGGGGEVILNGDSLLDVY